MGKYSLCCARFDAGKPPADVKGQRQLPADFSTLSRIYASPLRPLLHLESHMRYLDKLRECVRACGRATVALSDHSRSFNLSLLHCHTFLHGRWVAECPNEPITTNRKCMCVNWPREWSGSPRYRRQPAKRVLRNPVTSERISHPPLFIYSGPRSL
jgi:hypothetical protein